IGGAGVVSLLLWIGEHACRIIAGVTSFLPSLLDVVALHLTQGSMSVYGDFLGHDPYKAPGSPFPASRQLLPGQTVAAVLPQIASPVVDADVEQVVPIETTITEVPMIHHDKNASLLFVGRF